MFRASFTSLLVYFVNLLFCESLVVCLVILVVVCEWPW